MELKVSVDTGLERLEIICCWEDDRRKRVPVSRCHRDKRVGECVFSISIQLKHVVLSSTFFTASQLSHKFIIYAYIASDSFV